MCRITADSKEEDKSGSDSWICSVAAAEGNSSDDNAISIEVPRRGPTYTVKVDMEGVQIKAPLDHAVHKCQ